MADDDSTSTGSPKRSDARRNTERLLAAAAAAFVESGVDAPVRDIAARAGVGVGTLYRHFPTRADLLQAVYRHQVEACAQAGPHLLRDRASPLAALLAWVDMFIDFLVTKHGLANAMRSNSAALRSLHAFFLDHLVPVFTQLLEAAAAAGEVTADADAYSVMRAIGNLCVGADNDPNYDARKMAHHLVAGLHP